MTDKKDRDRAEFLLTVIFFGWNLVRLMGITIWNTVTGKEVNKMEKSFMAFGWLLIIACLAVVLIAAAAALIAWLT